MRGCLGGTTRREEEEEEEEEEIHLSGPSLLLLLLQQQSRAEQSRAEGRTGDDAVWQAAPAQEDRSWWR